MGWLLESEVGKGEQKTSPYCEPDARWHQVSYGSKISLLKNWLARGHHPPSIKQAEKDLTRSSRENGDNMVYTENA
ncbi:hypothetical protein DTL42_20825 [Bremerella cremea]|uniref:Uncharacterized protein n=1 Tax=Bremerella cremea TaxID=1031537 RepID=A0A368KJU8_9BACT|nr:hypothetical protein DTL42_20825 [Bremerella cremea]